MSDATRERLQAALSQHSESDRPPAWRPEVGEEILGRVVGWTEGQTRLGETKRIVILEDVETGERISVWLLYRVLADEIEEAKLEPGDTLLIRRLADRTSRVGQRYRKYEIAVDRDT